MNTLIRFFITQAENKTEENGGNNIPQRSPRCIKLKERIWPPVKGSRSLRSIGFQLHKGVILTRLLSEVSRRRKTAFKVCMQPINCQT
ncbi:hypothetical protein FH972_004873 [Carpinus fangiana]|uniref:Uncharacterized protein n=1 Tax=Carpinus fangiana TaxID=176857 RepID=A0A5N6QR06_9ROSI|nr:hypothetical protein FH972_004873 [Carpinus fangiana]